VGINYSKCFAGISRGAIVHYHETERPAHAECESPVRVQLALGLVSFFVGSSFVSPLDLILLGQLFPLPANFLAHLTEFHVWLWTDDTFVMCDGRADGLMGRYRGCVCHSMIRAHLDGQATVSGWLVALYVQMRLAVGIQEADALAAIMIWRVAELKCM
jgi:hypothetical protein